MRNKKYQKLKSKYQKFLNFRFFVLITFLFFFIALASVFWMDSLATPANNEIALPMKEIANLNDENPKADETKIIDKKIAETMANNSCNVKDEKIIRGYIEKIDEKNIFVKDGANETKVNLKPETIFVKVFVNADKVVSEQEIKQLDLGVNQDVVVSVFTEYNQDLYTLLIKQIVVTK